MMNNYKIKNPLYLTIGLSVIAIVLFVVCTCSIYNLQLEKEVRLSKYKDSIDKYYTELNNVESTDILILDKQNLNSKQIIEIQNSNIEHYISGDFIVTKNNKEIVNIVGKENIENDQVFQICTEEKIVQSEGIQVEAGDIFYYDDESGKIVVEKTDGTIIVEGDKVEEKPEQIKEDEEDKELPMDSSNDKELYEKFEDEEVVVEDASSIKNSVTNLIYKENDNIVNYFDTLNKNNKKEVIVAIIDTGYTGKNDRVLETINLSNEESIEDLNGHGTLMTNIILNNSHDEIKILPIKVANKSGQTQLSKICLAIETAMDNNVDIINISMSSKTSIENSSILQKLVDKANNNGIKVVVSAGNNGSDVKDYALGNIENAIVIGVTDKDGNIAEFSNYGDTVDYYVNSNSTSEATAYVSSLIARLISYNQSNIIEVLNNNCNKQNKELANCVEIKEEDFESSENSEDFEVNTRADGIDWYWSSSVVDYNDRNNIKLTMNMIRQTSEDDAQYARSRVFKDKSFNSTFLGTWGPTWISNIEANGGSYHSMGTKNVTSAVSQYTTKPTLTLTLGSVNTSNGSKKVNIQAACGKAHMWKYSDFSKDANNLPGYSGMDGNWHEVDINDPLVSYRYWFSTSSSTTESNSASWNYIWSSGTGSSLSTWINIQASDTYNNKYLHYEIKSVTGKVTQAVVKVTFDTYKVYYKATQTSSTNLLTADTFYDYTSHTLKSGEGLKSGTKIWNYWKDSSGNKVTNTGIRSTDMTVTPVYTDVVKITIDYDDDDYIRRRTYKESGYYWDKPVLATDRVSSVAAGTNVGLNYVRGTSIALFEYSKPSKDPSYSSSELSSPWVTPTFQRWKVTEGKATVETYTTDGNVGTVIYSDVDCTVKPIHKRLININYNLNGGSAEARTINGIQTVKDIFSINVNMSYNEITPWECELIIYDYTELGEANEPNLPFWSYIVNQVITEPLKKYNTVSEYKITDTDGDTYEYYKTDLTGGGGNYSVRAIEVSKETDINVEVIWEPTYHNMIIDTNGGSYIDSNGNISYDSITKKFYESDSYVDIAVNNNETKGVTVENAGTPGEEGSHQGGYVISKPVKKHYTLAGWEVLDVNGNKITTIRTNIDSSRSDGISLQRLIGSGAITQDIIVRAVWTANKYNYTIDLNGGQYKDKVETSSGIVEQTVTGKVTVEDYLGSTIVVSSSTSTVLQCRDSSETRVQQKYIATVPTRSGYVFDGWYVMDGNNYAGKLTEDSIIPYANISSADKAYVIEFSEPNMVIAAKWKSTTQDYILNPNTGTYKNLSGQDSSDNYIIKNTKSLSTVNLSTVTSSNTSSVISQPSKTGHEFKGWYKISDDGITPSDTGSTKGSEYWSIANTDTTSDVNMIAKYQPIDYTLTIDPNGGEFYYNSSTKTTSKVTQKMKYKSKFFISTTDTSGYISGSVPSTPTRTGYEFNGWYLTDDSGNITSTKFSTSGLIDIYNNPNKYNGVYSTYDYTKNITIKAKWTPIAYKQIVKYQLEKSDGTFASAVEVINANYNYGDTVSWSYPDDATYKGESLSYTVTSDKTTTVKIYKKQYKQTLKVYTENVDGTWSSATEVINANYRYGYTISHDIAATTTHQAASISWKVTKAENKELRVYRNQYKQVLNVLYEKEDGTFETAVKEIDANYRHGATVSWSLAATDKFKAASISWTADKAYTKELKVYRKQYTFNLKGYLQGKECEGLEGEWNGSTLKFGTCDVYVNGTSVANDVVDYSSSTIRYGSTIQIKDIKATTGYLYNGIYKGSEDFTLTGNSETWLQFNSSTGPVITYTVNSNWSTVDVVAKIKATDASGISKLELYKGSTLVNSWTDCSGVEKSQTLSDTNVVNYTIKATNTFGATATKNFTTRIDKDKPSITSSVSSGWYKADTELSFSATDVTSGMKSLVLKNSSGTQLATGVDSVKYKFTTEGSNSYSLVATDVAGNTTTKTITVKIDKTKPNITANSSYGWYTTDTELTFKVSDTPSGVKSFVLKDSEGKQLGSNTSQITHKFTTEGTNTYTLTATDNAGNTSTKTITVKIDKTKPVITTDVSTGWYTADTELTFKASDTPSGIKSFILKDSNGTTIKSGTSQIVNKFTAEGSNTYTLTATDNAGNTSTKTITVKIDKTNPTITANSSYGWLTADTELTFKASDTPSGIKSFILKDSSGATLKSGTSQIAYTFTTEGTNTYTLIATDNAGRKTEKTITVKLDKTKPVITANSSYGWYTDNTELSFKVSDTPSGVKSFVLKDSSGTVLGSSTTEIKYTFNVEGSKTYTLTATDNAGNVTNKTITVKIDKTNPTITANSEYGWYTDNTELSFKVSDTPSGVKSFVLTDSAGNQLASNTSEIKYTFKTEGINTYTLTAIDNANRKTVKTIKVKIDKTNPTITANSSYGWYTTDTTLKFTSADTLSGISSFVLKDENSNTLATGTTEISYKFTVEGAKTYTLIAKDVAGNTVTKNIIVKVDKTDPVITANSSYGWYSTDTTLTFKSSDAISGVKSFILADSNGTQLVTGTTEISYRFTVEGNKSYKLTVTDNANRVVTKTIAVKIDKTNPNITANDEYGWFIKDTSLKFTADDTPSGIKSFILTDSTGKQLANGTTEINYTFTTEGINKYTLTATDNSNRKAVKEIVVKVDKTNPVITANSEYGWYTANTTLKFSVSDSISGVKSFVLKDSTGKQLGSNTSEIRYTFTTEGINTYTLTATDIAGNIINKTITVKIDKIKPIITADSSYGWYTTDKELTFSASDTTSGMNSFILTDSSGTELATGTTSIKYKFNKEGTNTYKLTAKDKAGNTSTKTITVKIDKTNPVIDSQSTYGWLLVDTELTFKATDTISGINYFTLTDSNGTELVRGTSEIKYKFTEEGINTYTLKAFDIAGNSSTKTITVKIDKTKPAITANAEYGWYTTDTTLTFKTSDSISGVSTFVLKDSSGKVLANSTSKISYKFTTEGINKYTLVSTDIAGNSLTKTITIKIDKNKPTITANSEYGWYIVDTTLTFKTSDVTSGIKSFVLTDSEGKQLATGTSEISYKFTVEGNKKYRLTSTDIAGNVTTKDIIVKVDKTNPVIVFDKQSGNWADTHTITVTHTDSVSGIKYFKYAFSEGTSEPTSGWSSNITEASTKATINTDGQWYLHVRAYDIAGNSIHIKTTGAFKVDTTKPRILTTTYSYNVDNVDINITTTDYSEKYSKEGSGIYGYAITTTTEIPKNWVQNSSKSYKYNITEAGTYYIWVRDVKGNVSDYVKVILTSYEIDYINNYGGNTNTFVKIPKIFVGSTMTTPKAPENTTYTFINWNTSNLGNGQSLDENKIYVLTEDLLKNQLKVQYQSGKHNKLTMYGYWSKELKVIFNLNGGTYDKSKDSTELSAVIYNNVTEYKFNIIGGQTEESQYYYSKQVGSFNCYGILGDNGINTKITKRDIDGTTYRLLGWSYNVNDKVPNNKFIVYDENKSETLSVSNSVTLYAIWEPVLYVQLTSYRNLGLLYEEGTENITKVVTQGSNIVKDNLNGFITTIARPGEAIKYNVQFRGNLKSVQVTVDPYISNMYDMKNVIYSDMLNPITVDNMNEVVPSKGYTEPSSSLNRVIANPDKSVTRQFYLPQYLGSEIAEEASHKETNYYIDYKFVSDTSFYYEYTLGAKEEVLIRQYIKLKTSEDEDDVESVLNTLRTKLKIRIR